MATAQYAFRPLSVDDMPLIERWLKVPHVAEWWHEERQLERIRANIGDPKIDALLVHADARPIGYLQCYDPHAETDHPFRTQPAGTRGIDQFIGEPGMIGRGHGSALTRVFVERLFDDGAPCVVTDPDLPISAPCAPMKKSDFAAMALSTRHGDGRF